MRYLAAVRPVWSIPTPTPPSSVCPAPFIQTGPIQVTGGSGDGGKIAPPNPVVIGQDPERRGVDVKVNVLIPPVVYHYFETIRHDDLVCAWDSTGLGSGCPGHPRDSRWKTDMDTWYECIEHTQVFPDYLASAQVSINLTPASREWILTDLAQAYPGAHLLHPDFSFSFCRSRFAAGRPERFLDDNHPESSRRLIPGITPPP